MCVQVHICVDVDGDYRSTLVVLSQESSILSAVGSVTDLEFIN